MCRVNSQPHLVVIRAVGGLFHGGVLLFIAHLHTHHRVHIEADELPSLDHRDADLMGDCRHIKAKDDCLSQKQDRQKWILPRGSFGSTTTFGSPNEAHSWQQEVLHDCSCSVLSKLPSGAKKLGVDERFHYAEASAYQRFLSGLIA